MKVWLVLILALLLSVPANTFGQSYEITLGEKLTEVKPGVLNGMNFGNWMIVFDLLTEYRELNIPHLRFPAGNYGDENLLSEASLQLFMLATDALEATPMVQHNIFQGDVAEAVKWVRFVQHENLGIHHWFIGNEPDLYGPNRGAPHWTPEYYAEKFREYALAIKAIDPDAVIIGPAVTGTPNEKWLKTFLTFAGDVVDVLAWQWYPTDGSAPREKALATAAEVGSHIRTFRAWTQDPEINPLGWERQIPLFISEFGLSWRTRHARLLTDMTAALWLAEVYGEMVLAELDYAAYFALQGTGGHGLFDMALWPRPTYFVHWLLARMGDSWHAVKQPLSNEQLKAYGSLTAEEYRFLLINKKEAPLTLKFPQARGSITSLWVDNAEQVELKQKVWGQEVILASYSVTLVKFRRNNP